jgi:predicted RNase H-like nuclease (RuvC/YqgF family)
LYTQPDEDFMPMSSTASISTDVTRPAFHRSKSEPIRTTHTKAEPPGQATKPDISDYIHLDSKPKNPAANSAEGAKPLHEVVIDFFQELGQKIQELGQKILDIFTPTSQEAIEKALIKSQIKTEAYNARIASNRDKLDKGGLSELQQKVYEEDIKKLQNKLTHNASKIEALTAKLDKLSSTTAQATEAKVAQGVKTGIATETSNLAGQQSATEGLEQPFQESMESFLKEVENLFSKAKEIFSKHTDDLAALSKKVLR